MTQRQTCNMHAEHVASMYSAVFVHAMLNTNLCLDKFRSESSPASCSSKLVSSFWGFHILIVTVAGRPHGKALTTTATAS